MSINHNYTPKTTPWWTQQQHQATEEEEEDDVVLKENTTSQPQPEPQREPEEDEKEPMFEKPLTPSDVGKLNRLVIPKQHAERYFPLDSQGESKGLLLSFEDESGKCWRFRYSYWNSSQSYVLTKGWSRYVKDKRLDAGDVVLFHRHRSLSHRLFISWRRRHPTPKAHLSTSNVNGWNSGLYPAHPYPTHHHHHLPLSYQTHDFHAGGGSQSTIVAGVNVNSSSSSTSSSSSRVLRLFGVNMECQPDNNNNNNNMLSTQGTATPQYYHHELHRQSSNPHTHMVPQQPY